MKLYLVLHSWWTLKNREYYSNKYHNVNSFVGSESEQTQRKQHGNGDASIGQFYRCNYGKCR